MIHDQLESGTYFELRRLWKAGDIVELELPMDTQLMEADPFIEETFNQVAIKRGPIVYCLESVDLPEDIKITDVSISQDISLKPKYEKDCFLALQYLKESPMFIKKPIGKISFTGRSQRRSLKKQKSD